MELKKLIYVSKYLQLPSETSYGSRGYHIIKNIKDYEVEIITSNSNHLADGVQPFHDKSVTILNVLKIKNAKSFKRILSWIIFEVKLFFLLLTKPKADVIICSSLSFFTIINGLIYKKIFGSKLIFEIRDIWPLTLVEAGAFSNSNFLIKALRFIEKKGYTSSDLIIGTMPNLEEHVKKSVTSYPKIITIPMGYSYNQISSSKEITTEFNLDNSKINICYAGTLGISNNIPQLLKFAEFCSLRRPNYMFYFLGGGPLEGDIKNSSLSNVEHLRKVKRHEVLSALSKFDCLIFSSLKSRVWSFGQSLNKVVDYMLANKPILGFYDGYESMINETASGRFVPHENFNDAINFIDTAKTLKVTSKQWILENRNYRDLSSLLESELKSLHSI